MPDPLLSAEPGQVFATTRWSVALAARGDETARRAALEELCRAYWMPVYGYLRRRGQSPEDAEDLTQGFFVRILESDFLSRPDPARGRFRGYLIGTLKRFVSDHLERQGAVKRGGRARFIEWNAEDAERRYRDYDLPSFDPGAAYETSWALTLLARGLERLEQEQRAAGRERIFAALKPFLGAAPAPGDYERAAAQLGVARANVALQVHRLSQRYGELVRLEVMATVTDPAEVADEMEALRRALRR